MLSKVQLCEQSLSEHDAVLNLRCYFLLCLLNATEVVTFSSLLRGFGALEQDSGGNFTNVCFRRGVSQVSTLLSGRLTERYLEVAVQKCKSALSHLATEDL